jgi:signal peptidase II
LSRTEPLRRSPRPLFWALAAALLALDQAAKASILAAFHPGSGLGGPVTVVPGFFDLVFVENTGIAFGLFAGNNFLWLAVAAVFVAGAVLVGRQLNWAPTGTNAVAALLVSGALGNLSDRAFHGYVVDFLDFHWGLHHWPAFNVADSAITVAVAVIVFRAFFPKR